MSPESSNMLSSMAELFEGRSIFVTGASGFVGKVLVEKLLRSLPGIATIFVLIRPLKGVSSGSRWDDIESNVLFNQIRKQFPQRLRKVVVIEGDIAQDDFGISSENLSRLLAETAIVFHCAATVRFDEKLKRAVHLNVRGVKRMVELCHRMPMLEAFIHCSTSFVNVDKPGEKIAEQLHCSNLDAHRLLTALENLDDTQIDFISDPLIKNHVNTYCFSKVLGEQIVSREAADLPIVIFRPSIILSIWHDGIPGWADSFQGMGAIMGAMYTGALPRLPILSHNPKSIMDCVPVDVVVSMMIVSAGYRMSVNTDIIPVFHCCTSELNPLNLQNHLTIAQKYAMEYPAEKFLSSPSFKIRGFQCVESCRHRMRMGCLGPVLDKVTTLFRQQPFWTRLYTKIGNAYDTLLPFTRYYHFESSNMVQLIDMMNAEDKKTFDFDVRKINWNDFACNGILGLKTFLLKDDIVDPNAIRRAKTRLISHQLISLLPVFILCYMISVIATRNFNAWQIFLPLLLIVTLFTMKDWFTCTKIKPLEEYKEEIEKIMDEPIRSKTAKKQMV